MLLNNLFFIEKRTGESGTLSATLRIEANHSIFQGHFPGHPVVPGVCMVQLIRELMEENTGSTLRITEVDNIKFLAVIDPREHRQVQATVTYVREGNHYKVNATLFEGETTFFKLAKGVFAA
jgi:3-hydroxyacyl-[acyl-carrier-protein] dehydratase